METIEFRELVELFLHIGIYDIKNESEVPNINFIFDDDYINLFKDIVLHPFVKDGYWTPNATKKDIDYLLHQDKKVITINVNDGYRFFELLTEITNSLIRLRKHYGSNSNPRSTAMSVMQRIWLRLGIDDINNVELFLERQLQFINNMTFDVSRKKQEKVGSFYDYDVFMYTYDNETYDESTRSMIFTIKKDDDVYELPRILYDIDDNGTCYIYGVQNSRYKDKNRNIERKIYKINKNIEEPNVHPSKVYAMLFFINELKKKGISKIIVPSMQVLNYRYHEILGERAKDDLDEAIESLKKYPNNKQLLIEYEQVKGWYDRVYNKQDDISYLKTEELFNLVYRITEHDNDIEIVNEVNLQGDYLSLKFKKK